MSTDHEAEYADNHGTYGIPFDVRLVLSFARVPLAIAKVPTAAREGSGSERSRWRLREATSIRVDIKT